MLCLFLNNLQALHTLFFCARITQHRNVQKGADFLTTASCNCCFFAKTRKKQQKKGVLHILLRKVATKCATLNITIDNYRILSCKKNGAFLNAPYDIIDEKIIKNSAIIRYSLTST